MGESAKQARLIVSAIEVFDGTPSKYERWARKTLAAIKLYHPEIYKMIKGKKKRPKELYEEETPAPQPVQQHPLPRRRTTVSETFARAQQEGADKARAEVESREAETGDDDCLSTSSDPGGGTPINLQEIEDWDQANSVLFNVLDLKTSGVAASLVLKFSPYNDDENEDGLQVWHAMKNKFQPEDEQHERVLHAMFNNLSMKEGTDPDVFITKCWDVAHKLERLGDVVTENRIKHVIVSGLPPFYNHIKNRIDDDPTFNLQRVENTARSMYKRDQQEREQRRLERHQHTQQQPGDTHSRNSGMVAASRPYQSSIACHGCGESGHIARACPDRANNSSASSSRGGYRGNVNAGGGAGFRNGTRNNFKNKNEGSRNFGRRNNNPPGRRETKWCQLHNTPHHSNEECMAQAAGQQVAAPPNNGSNPGRSGNAAARAQQNSATTAAVPNSAAPAPQEATEPYSGRSGFSWATASSVPAATSVSTDPDSFTMLVDSGASEHFIDSDLIPDVRECLTSCTVLDPPMVITTAGLHSIHGFATGTLPCAVVDTNGQEHEISVSVTLVPGLGRHLFSPTAAQKHGIHTVFGSENYIDAIHFKVGLRHSDKMQNVDLRIIRDVHTRQPPMREPLLRDETPSAVAAVATSADLWHRRLGHPHEAVVRAVAKIPGAGVSITDPMTKCDTCYVNKSVQQAHPKTTVHKAVAPLQRVYTDLIGPLSPAAKGGYMYISKFSDEFTRFRAFYLIHSKEEAINTLIRFVQDLAIPHGRRVLCLRSDGGGEYRAKYYERYCKQTGIIQEFTATNTPQQNGISERDGRTILNMTRCLLQGANLPKWLWGEVCCTAVYIVNRLPHSALKFDTPYFRMFGEQASLSHLRVIGARTFVHHETHRSKLEDKAWEGQLVGYSKDSRAYRIYNSRTRRVVESRNVTFIETPDVPLPAAAVYHDSDAPPDSDSGGNINGINNGNDNQDIYNGNDDQDSKTADSNVDSDSDDESPIEPDGHDRRLRSRGSDLLSAPHEELSAKQRRALRQLAFSVTSNATSPLVPPASIPTPNTFRQAMQSPFAGKWKAAMEKELLSLQEHEVADLVSVDTLPRGASPVGSRWVFKVKPDGTFKARLVVQGFGQRHGIDCGGTFAPVCRISSQRTLLCIAASKGLHVEHLDVKTAFLNAPVEEDVWVQQAPGFEETHPETGKPQVLKLRKSLYGLRQSPRNWNSTFARAIESIGFSPIFSDPCVYVYGSGDTYVVLSIYVDDVLLLGVNPTTVKTVREQLMSKFSMTNLGAASLVLGMEIKQGDGYIKVSQGNYVEAVLQRFDFHDANPAPTPGTGKAIGRNPKDTVFLSKDGIKRYQEIVGSLMYLVNTSRWDIGFAVLNLTRGMAAPTETHMAAAKRVLRYLRGNPDLPTIYRKGSLELTGFTDSDFAGDEETRRSCTGFLFMLGGGVISSAAVLQKTISQSTTEAELIALHSASQEGVYLLNLLRELGVDIATVEVKLLSDSMSALSLSSQAMYSSRTKHIATKYHLIRQLIESGRVRVNHVPTNLQLSDLLTKHLPKPQFLKLRNMVQSFSSTN